MMNINASNFGALCVSMDILTGKEASFYAGDGTDAADASFLTVESLSDKLNPGSVTSYVTADELTKDPTKVLQARSREVWDTPLSMYRTALVTDIIPNCNPGETVLVESGSVDDEDSLFYSGTHRLFAMYHVIGRKPKTISFLERRGVTS